MEQPGVVALIGSAEELNQARVNPWAVEECHEPPVLLHPTILAYTQEDDAVNGALHGEVELTLGELRIAERDVPS